VCVEVGLYDVIADAWRGNVEACVAPQDYSPAEPLAELICPAEVCDHYPRPPEGSPGDASDGVVADSPPRGEGSSGRGGCGAAGQAVAPTTTPWFVAALLIAAFAFRRRNGATPRLRSHHSQ